MRFLNHLLVFVNTGTNTVAHSSGILTVQNRCFHCKLPSLRLAVLVSNAESVCGCEIVLGAWRLIRIILE